MIGSGGDGGGLPPASALAPDDRPGTGGPGAAPGPAPGAGGVLSAGPGTAVAGPDAGFGADLSAGLDVAGDDAADGVADDAGTAPVRAALAPLGRLATLPVRAHVAVFEQVFTELEATLATVADDGRAEAAADGGTTGGAARPGGAALP